MVLSLLGIDQPMPNTALNQLKLNTTVTFTTCPAAKPVIGVGVASVKPKAPF